MHADLGTNNNVGGENYPYPDKMTAHPCIKLSHPVLWACFLLIVVTVITTFSTRTHTPTVVRADPPPPTPPSVDQVDPAQNTLSVERSSSITVTFDKAMDATTIATETLVVHGTQTGRLEGSLAYNSSLQHAVFTPTMSYKPGELVWTSVTQGVADEEGTPLYDPYIWQFTARSTMASGRFSLPVTYTTGYVPFSVAAGDLNGDAHLDLAIADRGDNAVSIFINKGDGTFTRTLSVVVETEPHEVLLVDLDGDGSLDLVAVNKYSNTVSVRLNDEKADFPVHITYTVGTHPGAIVAADLDGDGDMDLATADAGSSTVSTLRNNGDGTFAAHIPNPVVSAPIRLAVGDMNGDGDLDLMIANYFSNSISVLENSGDGTFYSWGTYPVYRPTLVAVGDLDVDGDLDIVVNETSSYDILILENNGYGVFDSQKTISSGIYAYRMDLADLDGDGYLDLSFINAVGSTISVQLNTRGISFASPMTYPFGLDPSEIVMGDIDAGDFNGDGILDLAVVSSHFDMLSIMLGKKLSIFMPVLVRNYPQP